MNEERKYSIDIYNFMLEIKEEFNLGFRRSLRGFNVKEKLALFTSTAIFIVTYIFVVYPNLYKDRAGVALTAIVVSTILYIISIYLSLKGSRKPTEVENHSLSSKSKKFIDILIAYGINPCSVEELGVLLDVLKNDRAKHLRNIYIFESNDSVTDLKDMLLLPIITVAWSIQNGELLNDYNVIMILCLLCILSTLLLRAIREAIIDFCSIEHDAIIRYIENVIVFNNKVVEYVNGIKPLSQE